MLCNQVTELNRDWDDNIYYTLGQELSKDLRGFFRINDDDIL